MGYTNLQMEDESNKVLIILLQPYWILQDKMCKNIKAMWKEKKIVYLFMKSLDLIKLIKWKNLIN